MKPKFLRPNLIWLGVWAAIFFTIAIVGSWQKDLYWRDNLAKLNNLELITVHTVLPYAIAYLEEKNEPDLLQRLVDANLGPYALVLTDRDGNIKYAPQSLAALKADPGHLKNTEFFYLYRHPTSAISLEGPYRKQDGPPDSGAPPNKAEILGKLYLVAKGPYPLLETLGQAYGQILTPSESVLAFTLLSYIMVLVGFAGICAISAKFQNHFQEVREQQYEAELEARELRIQVLESNIRSADLRLQLLDRRHEQAQTVLATAKNTIAGLEKDIHYETTRNEELQEVLSKADSDRNEALETIRAIEQDRLKIAAELTELEVLREVEEMNYPVPSKRKARRPKEFLWLNLVYKNLHFSRRALQNIVELQNYPDIFPSLPEALATLNNSSIEFLTNGGGLPSRSVVRYTQPLAHHNGDFWEYRFSRDGRIFFGLSESETWNIDTILLKRKFTENRYKYEKYLEQTLGKNNNDLKASS